MSESFIPTDISFSPLLKAHRSGVFVTNATTTTTKIITNSPTPPPTIAHDSSTFSPEMNPSAAGVTMADVTESEM